MLYFVYPSQLPYDLGIIYIHILYMWKFKWVIVHCDTALRGRAKIQSQEVWFLGLYNLVILDMMLIMAVEEEDDNDDEE